MKDVNEINENEHLLMAENGFTQSYGGGMGDMGGFPTVYFHLYSEQDVLHKKAKNNSIRLFKITEIQLDNVEEYRQYLTLKKKYSEVSY